MARAFRSGVTIPVQLRMQPAIIAKIDVLVREKEYSSRSDFVNRTVIEYFTRKEQGIEVKDLLMKLIETDPDIFNRIKKIAIESVARELNTD